MIETVLPGARLVPFSGGSGKARRTFTRGQTNQSEDIPERLLDLADSTTVINFDGPSYTTAPL